jgi:hypothetical protein
LSWYFRVAKTAFIEAPDFVEERGPVLSMTPQRFYSVSLSPSELKPIEHGVFDFWSEIPINPKIHVNVKEFLERDVLEPIVAAARVLLAPAIVCAWASDELVASRYAWSNSGTFIQAISVGELIPTALAASSRLRCVRRAAMAASRSVPLMKPRTLCACHPVLVMSSASVAPPSRRKSVITVSFFETLVSAEAA